VTAAAEKTLAAPARPMPSVASMLGFAAEDLAKLDVDKLERLCALQERNLDRQARADWMAAMDAFQAEVPVVPKTSKAVDYETQGGKVLYTYASFETIVGVVRPLLTKHGLSFRFDSEVTQGGVTVVCHVSHVNGHTETSRFGCPVTAGTRIMNAPQKSAATVTYAKRQALIEALGLATCQEDTDARETRGDAPITEEQAAALSTFIDSVRANKPKLLAIFGVEKVADLRQSQFPTAMRMLEERQRSVRVGPAPKDEGRRS